jgi:TonB family protein
MSLILLVLAGLATAPGDSARCRPLSEPKRLPEPSLVLDTAALFVRLDSVAAVSPEDVAVSVLWSDKPEAYLFGERPHPPWHNVALELLRASLRPAPEHSSMAVQVHLQVAPNRRLRLARAILCEPQAVEGRRIKAVAPSPIPGYQPKRVRTRVLVSPSGAVTAVRILTSSGYPDIDQVLIQSIKARHYRPALLDGRPVAVWISDRGTTLAP